MIWFSCWWWPPHLPTLQQAVAAVLWVGSWVFFASFLLSQVPADYTPSVPGTPWMTHGIPSPKVSPNSWSDVLSGLVGHLAGKPHRKPWENRPSKIGRFSQKTDPLMVVKWCPIHRRIGKEVQRNWSPQFYGEPWVGRFKCVVYYWYYVLICIYI